MITNKEDFTKKRKTRIEVLEERIINLEKMIEEINLDLKEEGISEISHLESVLKELKEMKEKMILITNEDDKLIEEELNKLNQESLLILNNDKIRIMNQNIIVNQKKTETDEIIKKLQQQLLQLNMTVKISKKKEEELLVSNALLEDKVNNLKSKAYGYDIAKKFEMHQIKISNDKKINSQIDPNRNKQIEDNQLTYNLWERENPYNNKNPSKLEDLTKLKGLWIGNSTSNIEKLMYDVDSTSKKSNNLNTGSYSTNSNYNNKYSNSLNTNMRKISPMILNNK